MTESELRELLHDLARSLNEHDSNPFPDSEPVVPSANGSLRPGEDFDRRASWRDLLVPRGWTLLHTTGGVCYWRRPGKEGKGHSATTGRCRNAAGTDMLYLFSSNAPPLEMGRCYTPFRFFAFVECNQNFVEAARRLGQQGYGAKAVRGSHLPPIRGQQDAVNGELADGELPRTQRPLIESCTHDELLDMELAPVPWLVKELIPDEGMTFLGGKKKLGKSWLALQIAQAVAMGVPVLGREVVQGNVVYLCLEDGRRRVRSRLLKQQTRRGLPITYCTRFPPLDGDGMGVLHDLLGALTPKLVIVDTLAAAKTGKTEENAAGAMADIGNYLRDTAQYFKCGLIVTHHHGKIVLGDPGNDLRGSSALAGAADVNLGLYKEEGGYILRGEGRDIQEFDLALTFDPVTTWCWQVREDQRAALRDNADEEVLEALRALGEADAAAVATYVDKSVRRVRERLHNLRRAGQVQVRAEHDGRGGQPRILFSVSHGRGENTDDEMVYD